MSRKQVFEFKYKENNSLDKRLKESQKIHKKYPDRIPVICERQNGSNIPDIDKEKYLIPKDLTVMQFIYVIRKRIKLKPEDAIFLFVGGKNKLVSTSELMANIYNQNKDDDGFLYIKYAGQPSFG